PISAITAARQAPSPPRRPRLRPAGTPPAAVPARRPRRLRPRPRPVLRRRDRAASEPNAFLQALLHYRTADLDSPDHHGLGHCAPDRHAGKRRAGIPFVAIAVRLSDSGFSAAAGAGRRAADRPAGRQFPGPRAGRALGTIAGPDSAGPLNL